MLQYEIEGHSAVISLDDPRSKNALTDQLLDELMVALATARDDDAIRVIVLRSSSEKVFSSGGNLKAFRSEAPIIAKYKDLERFPRLFSLIAELGKPVIAAINGDVLAGSLGIVLSCDLVIATESSRFGCPEINVGAFPFMISALIYRNVPRMKANEMVFLGELMSARDALNLGFINTVVDEDDFTESVLHWAGRIASKSPLLMRLGKNSLNLTRDLPLRESLEIMQAQLALAFTTDDLTEGVDAFIEKRPPRWQIE